MSAFIQSLLALLAQLAPVVKDSALIANIVSTLSGLLPIVIAEYQDLIQPVKNIIAALSANPATTADQFTALQALDAAADAAFDKAAADYSAAHPAS